MKSLIALSLIAVAGALAGCAPAPLTKADIDGRIVCNTDQMAKIEAAAKRENKEVHWVNCPLATLRVVS